MFSVVGLAMLVLIILLSLGVPLPFCFGGSLLTMSVLGGVTMKGMMMWGFNQMISPVLLCIPLFIYAGNLMSKSGIAERLLDFVNGFVGRKKGGLGIVAVVTCAVIGAISGSGFTGIAATGPILIPRMAEEGYPRGYATALVTVSSVLGLLIPPSTIMIIYGWITETSILACFLSTVGPGLLVILAFSFINIICVRKFPNLKIEESIPLSQASKLILQRGKAAFPALLMPVIVLGGIYGGVFTPTEAAAVAVIYSIPVGFLIYRGLKRKDLKALSVDSATSVGAIMMMIIFCLMLSQTFVFMRVPQTIIDAMFGLTQNKIVLLLLINFLLFIIGMLVNDVTGMVLAAPMLLPLVKQLGISPVHFAAIMGVNLAMGGVTPPYASILYLGMKIGKVEFFEILKPAMMFIFLGYLPVVFLTAFWPDLSLFLPKLAGLMN